MIDPVTNSLQPHLAPPISLRGTFPSPNIRSSISSLRLADERPSIIKKIFRVLFYPFISLYEWIFSRISLSTQEYAALEEIIVQFGRSYTDLVYDREEGEERLRSVVQKAEDLLDRIEKKWFPRVEGMLFLKGNLLKLLIRAHATLSNDDEFERTRDRLLEMGGEIDSDLERDLKYMQTFSGERYRFWGWLINKTTQFVAAWHLRNESS